ncbi:MAG: SpoIIE family protein phosphatase [Atopobiaceae bacterium]|nr:SpoIIE family protein phosphatase [Atopobiaceae bacterium]
MTSTDGVFWDNEVRANRMTLLIMFMGAIVLSLSLLLNTMGIFHTGPRMYAVAVQGFVMLVVPVILCYLYDGKRWWLKYLMLFMLLFTCTRLDAVLTNNVVLIMAVPVVLSSRYFSKRFTVAIGVLTMVLMLVAGVSSLLFDTADINYYPDIPAGTQLVFDGHNRNAFISYPWDMGQVISNYIIVVYIPRLLLMSIIVTASVLVADRGHRMVLDEAESSSTRAVLENELNTAMQIQEGMLPRIFPPFPERMEFDMYATMEPAREVGGDFYDFFLIDDDHLGIVIADVSGKGVPAALFMMASKLLIDDRCFLGGSPAEVLGFVNDFICENNEAEMFVTVWLGIMDIATGRIRAANAGHEYPIVMNGDGRFELLRDKHGFVVGGISGARYTEYDIQLKPGDRLFLYTDGVPESMNSEGELFGTERILEALNSYENLNPMETIGYVAKAVDSFVGEADQFDDLTMLCLEYFGSDENDPTPTEGESAMGANEARELTIEATVDNIDEVTEFVNSELEAYDCPHKALIQIDIAIDELFGNIANYAYDPDTGPATVRVEVEEDPLSVIITFIDNGKPYDPLAAEEPDITLSADDRPIGGLGIFLVRKTMDDVSYEYKNGQNILRIRKNM